MAKITITQISVENFGPFRERQTINLDVKAGHPVVLIKALNGSGKTTLLTAMQIGLYGYKAIGDVRRSEYEKLIHSLQNQNSNGNSVIEITVLIEIGGAKRSVVAHREWLNQVNFHESFSVSSDGTPDIDFTENWDDFINGILPAELVQLFLFDGEKIEALANPERLPDLLKHATEVFLGLGGIDALENDLKAIERRTSSRNRDSSGEFGKANQEAENFNIQKFELEQRIDMLAQKHATAVNELSYAKKSLDKFTVKSQRDGLDAFQKASELKLDAETLLFKQRTARAGLRDTLGDALLPLAWFPKLWERYRLQWDADIEVTNSNFLAEEFKKRDARILKSIGDALPDGQSVLAKILRQDLSRYREQHQGDAILRPSPSPADIHPRILQSLDFINERLKAVAAADNSLAKAEQAVDKIPAEEQLGEIFTELKKHTKLVSEVELKLHQLSHELEEAKNSHRHVETRLNATIERIRVEFKDQALEAKSLEAAFRAKQALRLFRERLFASKAVWLSKMITEEFTTLLRKRNFIASVIVDPKTYSVTIEDSKGFAMPMERLSAGERQILAISVLSALIRERKGRFPVVVDTPLARLDRKHRESLIRNFFAKISHQVMVLSTDEEVEGPVYDALKPFISSEYELIYTESTRSTTVQQQFSKFSAGVNK